MSLKVGSERGGTPSSGLQEEDALSDASFRDDADLPENDYRDGARESGSAVSSNRSQRMSVLSDVSEFDSLSAIDEDAYSDDFGESTRNPTGPSNGGESRRGATRSRVGGSGSNSTFHPLRPRLKGTHSASRMGFSSTAPAARYRRGATLGEQIGSTFPPPGASRRCTVGGARGSIISAIRMSHAASSLGKFSSIVGDRLSSVRGSSASGGTSGIGSVALGAFQALDETDADADAEGLAAVLTASLLVADAPDRGETSATWKASFCEQHPDCQAASTNEEEAALSHQALASRAHGRRKTAAEILFCSTKHMLQKTTDIQFGFAAPCAEGQPPDGGGQRWVGNASSSRNEPCRDRHRDDRGSETFILSALDRKMIHREFLEAESRVRIQKGVHNALRDMSEQVALTDNPYRQRLVVNARNMEQCCSDQGEDDSIKAHVKLTKLRQRCRGRRTELICARASERLRRRRMMHIMERLEAQSPLEDDSADAQEFERPKTPPVSLDHYTMVGSRCLSPDMSPTSFPRTGPAAARGRRAESPSSCGSLGAVLFEMPMLEVAGHMSRPGAKVVAEGVSAAAASVSASGGEAVYSTGEGTSAPPRRRPLTEVPRLRNRFRRQNLILGGWWREKVLTTRRRGQETAARLGLDPSEWAGLDCYMIGEEDLEDLRARKLHLQRVRAARCVQLAWRSRMSYQLQLRECRDRHDSATRLQSWWRWRCVGWSAFCALVEERCNRRRAATSISKVYRGHRARLDFQNLWDFYRITRDMNRLQESLGGVIPLHQVVLLQAHARGFIARQRARLLRAEKHHRAQVAAIRLAAELAELAAQKPVASLSKMKGGFSTMVCPQLCRPTRSMTFDVFRERSGGLDPRKSGPKGRVTAGFLWPSPPASPAMDYEDDDFLELCSTRPSTSMSGTQPPPHQSTSLRRSPAPEEFRPCPHTPTTPVAPATPPPAGRRFGSKESLSEAPDVGRGYDSRCASRCSDVVSPTCIHQRASDSVPGRPKKKQLWMAYSYGPALPAPGGSAVGPRRITRMR